MKGLIIKDLMCLRKQRVIFCFLVTVTLILSVMFVLSSNFGNLHLARIEMSASDGMGDLAVDAIANMAMILFMLLPLSLTGDVTSVFIYDGKAEFAKVSASFPLSIAKRVLAKYIAAFSMLFVGVVVDLCISFVLSLLTDIVTFKDFFGITIFAASVLLIYGGLTLFFCFCMGYGKEQYAQTLSLLLIIATFVVCNFSKLKMWLTAEDDSDMNILTDALNAVKQKYYIPLMIALFIMLVSYVGSVFVSKRKRGVI